MQKQVVRRTRTKTEGSRALRRFIMKGGPELNALRKAVGSQTNLNNHAGTRSSPPKCAPTGRFVAIYEAHCGIKPDAWLTADERKRSAPRPKASEPEPCVEHCGGAE